eukprot:UN03583
MSTPNSTNWNVHQDGGNNFRRNTRGRGRGAPSRGRGNGSHRGRGPRAGQGQPNSFLVQPGMGRGRGQFIMQQSPQQYGVPRGATQPQIPGGPINAHVQTTQQMDR